ncbi:MAG: colicin M resistance protein CbrA [Firmicutes bacterium HGW-Firmicutes-20]|jgi:flavin-dependent dehydrogenase|nr:MAG: colicin M resistance protein CbrA [Firmicutes bacterium HGW-Firmicutes-20]
MRDVIIIGGGPAGSTLARLIGKDFNVVLIDKKNKDEEKTTFKKPCGGLIAPDAQRALARFQLQIPTEVLANPQIFAVKTIDLQSKLITHYQRFYLNVNRHRFDSWMLSLVQDADVIEDARVIKIEKTSIGYEVTYIKDDKQYIEKGRMLVGADGADSIVRKTFFKRKIRQYMAIQQVFNASLTKPLYASLFDHTLTDSYGWGLIKDDELIFGAALPLQDSRKNFELLKSRSEIYDFNTQQPLFTEACLVNSPKSIGEIECGESNVFLIGESAGFISPSSLEGISYALDSALALAKAMRKSDIIKAYKINCRRLKTKIWLKHLKSIVLYTPLFRRLVMMSKLDSITLED